MLSCCPGVPHGRDARSFPKAHLNPSILALKPLLSSNTSCNKSWTRITMLSKTTCTYIQAPTVYVSAVHTHTNTHKAHHTVLPLQALGLFHCDIPSLGQILCQIEMENVASSIVKGAIYFDLIKGPLVGPHCLILWEYVWKRGSSPFKTWRLFCTLKRGKVEWQYSTRGKKTTPKMEMASQSPRAASVKTLSTWHKPASPTEGESRRKQQRVGVEREEDRQKGLRTYPCPPSPEIGFILNQNKSLSHKSQQLRLNLSRNCDEIYCGR